MKVTSVIIGQMAMNRYNFHFIVIFILFSF
jgi:hypothetical protein